MILELERFKQMLRANNVSITSARIDIFKTLLESGCPIKNGEVASRTPKVNRSSVYRALELFNQLGITTTLVRGWTPFVELADPFRPHHHHLVCQECRTSVDITSQKIELLVAELAEKQSFTPTSHSFEINGICERCSAQARQKLGVLEN